MQVVYVHKDISEYEEKVVGKLSARVAACVGGGIAASVAAAAFAHLVVGVEVADATMPVMMCSMPFWLAAFWRPKGMKPEEFVPLAYRHWAEDSVVTYEPGFSLAADAWPDEKCRRFKDRNRLARGWRKGGERYEPSKGR